MPQVYEFTKRTSADGTITIDNLPAGQEFTVVVRPPIDKTAFAEKLAALREHFQANNPLAEMSEAELDLHLRRSRDEAYEQLYGDSA